MSNDNNNEVSDFFSRSITAAFAVASNPMDGLYYKRPELDKATPASQNDVLSPKRRDPWKEGWHNGFPPGAGA